MVHQYKLNGYNIVLDSESGCVHTVDDVAYDVIELYQNTPREEIVDIITKRHNVTAEDVEETLSDIDTLKDEHQLFTRDLFAGQAELFKERQSVVKAICLHVAHACNMTCGYCFAGEGEYHGEKALMSYETGKRALDWLIENFWHPAQSGSGFLRRRTSAQLRRCEKTGCLWAQQRKRM